MIYIITNRINQKQYVGKTIKSFNARLSNHLADANNGSQFAIHRAIRKYGIENFTFKKLAIDKDHLNIMEKVYIRQLGTFGNGYNMTPGGDGGSYWKGKKRLSFSAEWRKNLSKAHKGLFKESKHPMFGRTGSKSPVARSIVLTLSNDQEESFLCMKDACRKYSLDPGALTLVAQGKLKQTKGFKCRYLKGI